MTERHHATIATKAHALRHRRHLGRRRLDGDVFEAGILREKNADWDLTRNLVQQLHHEIQRTIDFIPNIRAMA